MESAENSDPRYLDRGVRSADAGCSCQGSRPGWQLVLGTTSGGFDEAQTQQSLRGATRGLSLRQFRCHLCQRLEVANLDAFLHARGFEHPIRLCGQGCGERRLPSYVVQPPSGCRLPDKPGEEPRATAHGVLSRLVQCCRYRWTTALVIARHLWPHRSITEEDLPYPPRNAPTESLDEDARATAAAVTTVVTTLTAGLLTRDVRLLARTDSALVPVESGGDECRPVDALTPGNPHVDRRP